VFRFLTRHLRRRATIADTRWLDAAFRDVEPVAGSRAAMLDMLAGHARVLRMRAGSTADSAGARVLSESLLHACQILDEGRLRLRHVKFTSYVDISLQVAILRIFVEGLCAFKDSGGGRTPLALTTQLLEDFPDARPALIVHADLLLERDDVDRAIVSIERALRIQAVCQTAQQRLMQALRRKRALGGTGPELDAADYDLSDKFCPMPFAHLATGWKGNAFACDCPAWVPFPIGNVLEASTAEAVWNSPTAIEIRRSILDGDFSYCSRTLCAYIAARKLPRKDEVVDPLMRRYIEKRTTTIAEAPRMVQLNYDNTCNLACPSCRTGMIVAKREERDAYARARDRVILPLLKRVNGQSYLSGGGEAFSSPHYRSILSVLNRRDYPGLSLHLITNGLLATEQQWNAFPDLPEMIDVLSVSIDAATAGTYEQLRRPGRWATLLPNLEVMAEMRRAGRIRSFWINFVVQKDNYREMPAFVELGEHLGVDRIWFQRVTNYGAYAEARFADVDVTAPSHPEHSALLEILRLPLLQGPSIKREMLMPLLPEVRTSDERIEALY
jgi:MoaA/NifB/PqqE/SkfB family radical SAM enzyme